VLERVLRQRRPQASVVRQPAPSSLFDSLDLSCTQRQRRQVVDANAVDNDEERPCVQSARAPEPHSGWRKLPSSSEKPPPLKPQDSHHSGSVQPQPPREDVTSMSSTPLPKPEAHNGAVSAVSGGSKGYTAMKANNAEVPSLRQHMPAVPVKLAVHDSRWGKGAETEEDRDKRLRREKALAYAEDCREKSRQVKMPLWFPTSLRHGVFPCTTDIALLLYSSRKR